MHTCYRHQQLDIATETRGEPQYFSFLVFSVNFEKFGKEIFRVEANVMGKNKRLFHKKRRETEYRKPNYEYISKENKDFDTYYKEQKICPEEEWEQFKACLVKDLPVGVRITSYPKEEALALLEEMKKVFDIRNNDDELNSDDRPFPLPWYPDRLGWQMHLDRNLIRKSEMHARLHRFLVSETECGYISRQEVVSMIPPLLLDIQSHHKVLDFCAAPGSKTAQLIEMLHAGMKNTFPDGMVVANDVCNKRCYLLAHQAKRLNSPCLVITNHDASLMPNFFVTNSDGKREKLKFDRILCDVPCTGDGTLRKNPAIWLKWNSVNGNNLHGVQFRILKRGLEMLTVGGRLVYSTCSLNPIENEAVVHRILSDAEGTLKLEDASTCLPGLKYSKGLNSWSVASKNMKFYQNYDQVPKNQETIVRPQMFPPTLEKAAEFHLDKCLRILPHHQNTGGFFVAVFEKLDFLPWECVAKTDEFVVVETSTVAATEGVVDGEASQSSNGDKSKLPPKKRRKVFSYREDPFVFFKGEKEKVWSEIKDFYNISSSDIIPSCLMTRCLVGKKKNIYFTSPAVKNLITSNENRFKGLASIFPFLSEKRKMTIAREDLIKILANCMGKNSTVFDALSHDLRSQAENIGIGSCVLQLKDENLPLKLVGWRGNASMRAYVNESEITHFLRILGQDVSSYVKNNKPEVGKDADDGNAGNENVAEFGNQTTTTRVFIDDEDKCVAHDGLVEGGAVILN